MSLIYQGPISQRIFKHPSEAYDYGEGLLGEIAPHHRLDCRLAWEDPGAMEACALEIGENFDGCWIDIAVVPTESTANRLITWVKQLSGGQLSFVCLKKDVEAEVSISLPPTGAERYDDEWCNKTSPGTPQSIRVRISQLHRPGEMTSGQMVEAAQHCRSAYSLMASVLNGGLPTYESWLAAQTKETVASEWAAGDHKKSSEWMPAFEFDGSEYPWERVNARVRTLADCPTELTCEFPIDGRSAAISLLVKWINLLANIETVTLRCRGTRLEILEILDGVDLYHYHPNRSNHTYGVTTIHAQPSLDTEAIKQIIKPSDTVQPLLDWDLRWSNLSFELNDGLTQLIGQTESHFTIRTDSARTVNQLKISLMLNDPQDARFRNAKRVLGSHFGETIGRESAWEFEGPRINTPLGRSYQKLQGALQRLVLYIGENGAALDTAPTMAMTDLIPFMGQGNLEGPALVEKFLEVINANLPGFRFDRRAHVTEKYFLEFVRRTPSGFHLIEIQRYYRPAGFSVRVGVSEFHIPFNDLIPATGCSVPGIVVPLEHLAPERPERWNYKKSRTFDRVLNDFSCVLSRRIRPFFEEADALLQEFRSS